MMSMPTLTDHAHEHRVSRAEFEAFRDGSHARYELLDGAVLVTPSPSTSHGVEHYWIVAPDTPSLTVYRLDASGGYREEAHIIGDEGWTAKDPVEITLCAADLVH